MFGGISSQRKYEVESEVAVTQTIKKRKKMMCLLLSALVITTAVASFLIGYYVTKKNGGVTIEAKQAKIQEFHDKYQSSISTADLEDGLRYFSRRPHLAGSRRQRELAQYLNDLWKSYGFDEVEMPEYKVLLSFPQDSKPNRVSLIQNGTTQFEAVCQMNVTAGPGQSESFLYTPYIAYSKNGTVEGELVYANQGLESDFQLLAKQNISVKGKIVIFKSIAGGILRAATYGAIGALIYPDPIDNSKEGHTDKDMYPNTVWNSRDAVFEKPLRFIYGDPLTPELPSLPGMYRRPLNQTGLPSIPSQPISFKDALYFLSRMKGNEVPKHWRGALNITYRFGPGFKTQNTTVRLEIHNQMQQKSIFNVIGTIRGREEPDRYVLIGNHRDAWLFGAVDPSSGTATLAEMSRVLGNLLKAGWRPRRTIKFCSWGAEEFGLIGSVEWVEENSKILSNRAIAYLNTDVAVGGNYVIVTQTCPIFVDFIFSWAKKIRDPNASGSKTSIYDIMVERYPSKTHKGEPQFLPFAYMSDYLPFYTSIGIPSADFSYFFGHKNSMELYPVYHTQYDTFYWVKKFIDPEFKLHATMAKFQGAMLLDLADTSILPFDVGRVSESLNGMLSSPYISLFKGANYTFEPVVKAIHKFSNASKLFLKAKAKLTGKESPLLLRIFNDQMVQVEKAFIRPKMFSLDPLNKHVIMRSRFPGVINALIRARSTGNLDEAKIQLSIVAEAISSAADILQPLQSKGQTKEPAMLLGPLLTITVALSYIY